MAPDTRPSSPFTADLTAAIEKALTGVERKGHVSWGISTAGAELAAGWRPSRHVWVAGVVQTQWGGHVTAGVKGQIKW